MGVGFFCCVFSTVYIPLRICTSSAHSRIMVTAMSTSEGRLDAFQASLDDLWDMDVREIGSIIRNHKAAPTVARLMEQVVSVPESFFLKISIS